MDISLLNHVILLLLASSVSAAPPEQQQQQVEDEDVLHVIRCRAMCLDEFSGVSRTESHCQTEKECKMCWDACSLLHTSFSIWGPMCTVQDICFPGCQKACSTVTTGRDFGREVDSSISLHSLYDPQTDKVTVEWNHPKESETQGSVLYAVLLREKSGNCQEWEELTQTTSHVIQVKRGLLGRDTDIRLVAANASGQVTDTVTSYLDSLVAEPDNSISSSIDYEEEDENIPQIIHHSGRWRPHLLSIRQNHKSLGVQATVTWPLIRSPGAAKYEVSWNVIDDTIEITGHLQTASNVAVLTLWPNALYSVQISAYVDNEDPVTKSEPLVVDTRLEKPALGVSSAPLQCRDNQDILIASLFVIVIFAAFVIIAFCCCKCAMNRTTKSTCMDESDCSDETFPAKNPMGQVPISQSISSLQIPHSPVGESQEQLIKCSVHGSPYMPTSKSLHTHIDLRNVL